MRSILHLVFHQIPSLLQSRKDDKKEPLNYHVKCFFVKQRLTTEGDVDGFEKLRIADQNRIKDYISKLTMKFFFLSSIVCDTEIDFVCSCLFNQLEPTLTSFSQRNEAKKCLRQPKK